MAGGTVGGTAGGMVGGMAVFVSHPQLFRFHGQMNTAVSARVTITGMTGILWGGSDGKTDTSETALISASFHCSKCVISGFNTRVVL